jgi:peptidoglycan/LPS O-acetylase OafA/YrhL
MGIIRLILALSVLLNHTWPDAYLLASGRIPVQLFFIISGFLISYILVEKNFYTSIFDFYINRILRIYPLYIFVATLTFLFLLQTKGIIFFTK